MIITDMDLKPCPWCGEVPEVDAVDRLITITCKKCGYYRSFKGIVQTIPNDHHLSDYKDTDGKVIFSEYYHPYAHERATKEWNKRWRK